MPPPRLSSATFKLWDSDAAGKTLCQSARLARERIVEGAHYTLHNAFLSAVDKRDEITSHRHTDRSTASAACWNNVPAKCLATAYYAARRLLNLSSYGFSLHQNAIINS